VTVTAITTEDKDYIEVLPQFVDLWNIDDPLNNLQIRLSKTVCTTYDRADGTGCRVVVTPTM
jgi:hypothetical protein